MILITTFLKCIYIVQLYTERNKLNKFMCPCLSCLFKIENSIKDTDYSTFLIVLVLKTIYKQNHNLDSNCTVYL